MKKTSLLVAIFATVLASGCSKSDEIFYEESPVQKTELLSSVRDGYFQTKVSTDGDWDIDQLMRSLYFSKIQQVPLSVSYSSSVTFTGNASVEIRFNIYPIHCFSSEESMADEGDYYFVEQVTTMCSGPAYTRQDKEIHIDGQKNYCTGFYLKGLKMEAILTDSLGNQVGSFRQVPVPATSTGSTTHTAGFDFSLSGGFSGATPGIPTLSGSIGYSKSSAAEIHDLKVTNTHDNKGTVSFAYDLQNIPEKELLPLPPVSIYALDLPAAWIWFIPNTSGSQEYTVKMNLTDIVYRTHLKYNPVVGTGWAWRITDTPAASMEFSFNIPAPNRVDTGTIIVRNNSSDQFFTNPEIQNVQTGEILSDMTNGAYGPGQEFTAVLPEGTYAISVQSGGVKKSLRKQYTLDLSESRNIQAFVYDE